MECELFDYDILAADVCLSDINKSHCLSVCLFVCLSVHSNLRGLSSYDHEIWHVECRSSKGPENTSAF